MAGRGRNSGACGSQGGQLIHRLVRSGMAQRGLAAVARSCDSGRVWDFRSGSRHRSPTSTPAFTSTGFYPGCYDNQAHVNPGAISYRRQQDKQCNQS